MKVLETLLERFSRSLGRDSHDKQVIADVIYERLGFALDHKNVSIEQDALVISTTPARKNEIHLHEEILLSDIRDRCRSGIRRIVYR